MQSLNLANIQRFFLISIALVAGIPVASSIVHGQVTPEEHAKHHPEQSQGKQQDQGSGSKNDGGEGESGMGGMMGGGMGSMMDGMMEKMGAPKPKELYPSLMDFPSLSASERANVQELAHQRMQEGTKLLSEGLDELANSAPTDDFSAMQSATSKMREGLAQFESGLAAHRAIKEGKAPQNIALNWFKREMNLLPPTAAPSQGLTLFGMSLFHSLVMLGLILFAATMIWMYFFKMRRAAALLDRLTAPDGMVNPTGFSTPGSDAVATQAAAPPASQPNGVPAAAVAPPANAKTCCDETDADCPTEQTPDGTMISTGLLPVAKKKLCRLRVARIIEEAHDVKTFRLVACHGGGIPFSYLPGQFLTFTLPVDEKPIKRSYTISSSPTQGYYCDVTVKREEQGAGSRFLHDQVNVGDTLEVKAPSGRFTFTGEESDNIVLISGGVGITPMMSITRALTDMCWRGEIYFVAACRDAEHFIFESELKTLQQQHVNLHVFAAMSRLEKPHDGYRQGRLNKELLAEWIPDIQSKRIHICGPPAMMDAVKEMLGKSGVPAENIHTENFGSTQKPKPKVVEKREKHETIAKENSGSVAFTKSGKSTAFQPDETILEAAERTGVDIDYSCRVGTCGECAVKLISGNVSMEIDDGLEPGEKEAGMILACQATSNEDVSVEA